MLACLGLRCQVYPPHHSLPSRASTSLVRLARPHEGETWSNLAIITSTSHPATDLLTLHTGEPPRRQVPPALSAAGPWDWRACRQTDHQLEGLKPLLPTQWVGPQLMLGSLWWMS